MARGRKPLPDAVHELRGRPGKRKRRVDTEDPMKGEAPDPSAIPDSEIAALPVPSPPKHLPRHAQDEWRRIAPILVRKGLLREADRIAFETRCRAYSDLRTIEERLKRDGAYYKAEKGIIRRHPAIADKHRLMEIIRKFDSEFGLTPAARARVSDSGRMPEAQLPLPTAPGPHDHETPTPPAAGAGATLDRFIAARPATKH